MLQETVLVVGDDGERTDSACARLEAAHWTIVRARADEVLTARISRVALVVFVAAEGLAAEPLVRSVGHAFPGVPKLVFASHCTAEDCRAVMAAGASDCIEIEAFSRRPEAVLAERVLEIHQLRRRLREMTEHEQARARMSNRVRDTVRDELDLLRAIASSVLISLRALRSARSVLLTSGEATVVDSLCSSVQSMFPLFDHIDGSTPAAGSLADGPHRPGAAGSSRRS